MWSSVSLEGQKFSKQALPLVKDVDGPACQQSRKQRSLFIKEVNSFTHRARHCKVKNVFNSSNTSLRTLLPSSVFGLDLPQPNLGHSVIISGLRGNVELLLELVAVTTTPTMLCCFCLFSFLSQTKLLHFHNVLFLATAST